MDEHSILITGGSGMLADAFKRRLPAARVASRAAFDITNPDHLSLLRRNSPSVVINCAAYTKVDAAEQDVEAAEQINGHAVGKLSKMCGEIGATLVHFSTDYVFDGSLRRPLRPNDPTGPKSVYGRSKLIGEQLIQQSPPPRWLIIRTAWLYGAGGPNFPQAILNAARAGKPLNVIDDQVGCPTLTDDLAAATLDLLKTDASGIFHAVNSGETNWHDFAAAILEEFKVEAPLTRTTSAAWKALRPNSAPRPAYSVLSTSDLEKAIGRLMPTWREALTRYAHGAD